MRQILIVGKTNVGKTLFVLNFAAYLGMDKVAITFRDSRSSYTKEYLITEAIARFVSEQKHYTRSLQAVEVSLPKGKSKERCQLVDSAGLVEQIHPDPAIRQAMGQTLGVISGAAHFLHLIDASQVNGLSLIDRQLLALGRQASSYALVANKWDLVADPKKLEQLRKNVPNNVVIAVSALQRTGFKEVRAHVRALL